MKFLPLFAGALLVVGPLLAAPPNPESIDRLLKASNVEQNLTAMYEQIDSTMKTTMALALKSDTAGEDAKTYADAFSKKMSAQIRDEMSWARLKDLYAKVYAESFTQEEVDGLIAFYEGPAGKAFMTKMPVVAEKTTAAMQERMGPMTKRLQQAMHATLQEVQAEQKKKGK